MGFLIHTMSLVLAFRTPPLVDRKKAQISPGLSREGRTSGPRDNLFDHTEIERSSFEMIEI